MLTVSNTENYAGVRISGDYWDFEELRLALAKLLLTPTFKDTQLDGLKNKLLDLHDHLQATTYGNANIETTFNGINSTIRDSFKVDFPLENIYFSMEELWPTMIFTVISINHFIENSHDEDFHMLKQPSILTLQKLQSTIFRCLTAFLKIDEQVYFEKLIFQKKRNLANYPTQYIDFLNMKYLSFSRDDKYEQLPKIIGKICIEDNEYIAFKSHLTSIAKQSNLSLHNVVLQLEYPQKIIW